MRRSARPDTLPAIEKSASTLFSPVCQRSSEPTIGDITNNARGEVASLGLLDLAVGRIVGTSAFVDAVVAHDQTPLRHPVRQRFFALFLYVVMLVFLVATAPVMVVGPRKV